MLSFEVALCQALAEEGICPQMEAEAIAVTIEEIRRSHAIDLQGLTAAQSNHATPVPALVAMVRQRVPAASAPWVHYGATSQDVVDTALSLTYAKALDTLMIAFEHATERLVELACTHRKDLAAGRTLLKRGAPITVGLRFAQWAALLLDVLDDLYAARARLELQLGGSVGTLSLLGKQGLAVGERMAALLGLHYSLPWHTNRHNRFQLASAITFAAIALDTISNNVILLSQDEISEVMTCAGNSSAMPNKQNPAQAVLVRTAARCSFHLAQGATAEMGQELERGAGTWQSELRLLPEAIAQLAGAISPLHTMLATLEVDIFKSANTAVACGPSKPIPVS
jgi:3-carboxy-cis,cis-muconate cycloisomerase